MSGGKPVSDGSGPSSSKTTHSLTQRIPLFLAYLERESADGDLDETSETHYQSITRIAEGLKLGPGSESLVKKAVEVLRGTGDVEVVTIDDGAQLVVRLGKKCLMSLLEANPALHRTPLPTSDDDRSPTQSMSELQSRRIRSDFVAQSGVHLQKRSNGRWRRCKVPLEDRLLLLLAYLWREPRHAPLAGLGYFDPRSVAELEWRLGLEKPAEKQALIRLIEKLTSKGELETGPGVRHGGAIVRLSAEGVITADDRWPHVQHGIRLVVPDEALTPGPLSRQALKGMRIQCAANSVPDDDPTHVGLWVLFFMHPMWRVKDLRGGLAKLAKHGLDDDRARLKRKKDGPSYNKILEGLDHLERYVILLFACDVQKEKSARAIMLPSIWRTRVNSTTPLDPVHDEVFRKHLQSALSNESP